MSREINMDDLSEDDILYLADRDQLPDDIDNPRVQELDERLEAQQPPGPEPAPDEPFSQYEDMGVTALKDELTKRGLPTSGTKQELIDRLEEDDQA